MHIFIRSVMLATAAVMIFGCGPSAPPKSATQTEKAADTKAGDTKACAMQSGGHDVLQLAVPLDTECVAKDGSLVLSSQHRNVQLWLVSGVPTVDEALGHVSEVIKSEFKNFKGTQSTDLTIAGMPAKRQHGSGEEADDGDEGQADVIVFKLGEHIFVACVHGEALNPAAQEWMLTLLKAAKGA
jgi:hypothetical protein